MDEMIGVGDAQFIEKARRRLEMMMGDVKILVLASHNEQILRTFCTRALLLTEGTIAFCGTVDDCLEHYLGSTTAVAQPDPG
jgi:ABC-type polysaccharide/polyol phosphate transport system ATPase subunit